MRIISLTLLLVINISVFSQSEIMDSIELVRSRNQPELGKSLSTDGYWNAIQDNGASLFRRICTFKPNISLKVISEQKKEKFCVLTVHFMVDNIARDEVYLFLKKESGKWLMDGFNETKVLIKYFLDGKYSGHFSPLELSADSELEDLGKKIVSFGLKEEELLSFLEQNVASGSITDFVGQLTDPELGGHVVSNTGYDKKVNQGFIHFESKKEFASGYSSSTTIILSKLDNGKLKIVDRVYSSPFAGTFLYNIDKKLQKD